jgi:hypothetical protein
MTTAFTPARKKLAIESGMCDFDRRAYGWLSSLPVPSPSGLLSSLPVSPPPHDWKEEKKEILSLLLSRQQLHCCPTPIFLLIAVLPLPRR